MIFVHKLNRFCIQTLKKLLSTTIRAFHWIYYWPKGSKKMDESCFVGISVELYVTWTKEKSNSFVFFFPKLPNSLSTELLLYHRHWFPFTFKIFFCQKKEFLNTDKVSVWQNDCNGKFFLGKAIPSHCLSTLLQYWLYHHIHWTFSELCRITVLLNFYKKNLSF